MREEEEIAGLRGPEKVGLLCINVNKALSFKKVLSHNGKGFKMSVTVTWTLHVVHSDQSRHCIKCYLC